MAIGYTKVDPIFVRNFHYITIMTIALKNHLPKNVNSQACMTHHDTCLRLPLNRCNSYCNSKRTIVKDMGFKIVKDVNRDLCKDFCDVAGDSGRYTFSWVHAILLDIVIPIGLFLVGITTSVIGVILEVLFSPLGIIVSGIAGLIILLVTIGAIVVITFLEFREIGIFILIPIVMTGIIIITGFIPIINIGSFLMSLVPWNIVAVVAHMFIYKFDKY